jgi:TetR/AcrR family transcriptional regulator, mexJK operon transcriptional repressor
MGSGAATSRPDDAGESRSARKRAVIVDAATVVFLENGYVGTTMDGIAARAGVSKPTVYRYFADKEKLFSEIVLGTIDQVGAPFFEWIDTIDETDDLERALGELAHKLVAIVAEPRLLELRRLVIGETARFPKLGAIYFERGPGRTVETLASVFERLARGGLLQLPDPHLAAQEFNWLVLSIPLNRAMFSVDVRFSAGELERYADEAVRVFLAAYAVS